MPIAVACPKCQKKFNLPDQMMGRQVKCPACEAHFQIPTRAGAQQKMDPKQLAAQQKARAEAQQRATELQKMGVDGVIQRTPDVFDGTGGMQGTADPLANHMIDDPGFADVKYSHTDASDINESDDPMAGMFENPAIEQPRKQKTKKRKQVSKAWYQSIWLWVGVVALIGAVVAVLFLFVFNGESTN